MAQDLSLNVSANTSNAQASIGQLATLTEAQMKRIASFVRATTTEQDKMAQSMKAAANSDSYQRLTEGAKKVESAHAGVNRELLVLAHELSQGNFSRFGGSMLVLAERTNALEFALTGAGAATLGVGVALVGSIALMAMGAIEADKFAKALQLTGNYAAVTQAQVAALAAAQSHQTGQSVGGARGSVEAVAGSGLFGPAQLAVASRALGDYQKLTGETAADALKKFQTIQDGVAKWAEEENKSIHFLTAAEYEHIKALEDSGDKEGAAIAALNAYAGAIESRGEPALGILARAWHSVADAAGRAGQAIMDVGRPTDGLTSSLAAIDKQISLVRQANTARPQDASETLQNLGVERQRVAQLQFKEDERRASVATNAAIQQAAISADRYADSILKGAHALSARNDELKKWDAAVAAKAAAGTPFSTADISAGRAEIMKRYASQPGDKQADEYKSLEATIKAYNTTTDEEMSRMGKLTEGQKFLIQVQESLVKSGKALSDQQKAGILADATKAATLRDIADGEIRARAATLARIQADTANQDAQQSILDSVVQSGNEQANAILRQSETIGMSADAVTKFKALQGFDDMIGKALLGADGDTAKRINDVATTIRGNLITAIDDARTAQDAFNDSYSNGFKKASADYVKQSQDNAGFAEKFFTDAVNGMTDALTTFATTGKLSWKSLIDSMINDLVRMEVQKGFGSLLGGNTNWGSSLSVLGSLGGGVGVGGLKQGSFSDLFSGDFMGGALAGGIDNVPYNGMPAVLHEGERVMTRIENQQSRSSAGGASFDFSGQTINVGQGVSRAEVYAALQQSKAETLATVSRQVKTGRIGA